MLEEVIELLLAESIVCVQLENDSWMFPNVLPQIQNVGKGLGVGFHLLAGRSTVDDAFEESLFVASFHEEGLTSAFQEVRPAVFLLETTLLSDDRNGLIEINEEVGEYAPDVCVPRADVFSSVTVCVWGVDGALVLGYEVKRNCLVVAHCCQVQWSVVTVIQESLEWKVPHDVFLFHFDPEREIVIELHRDKSEIL